MRVLLDNNIPVRFASLLTDHEVAHVRDRGWQSMTNGDLVRTSSADYDVLVTADQNMPFQTSLKGSSLSVLILVAPSNRLADLAPLASSLLRALRYVKSGEYIRVP